MDVLLVNGIDRIALALLLERYGLELSLVAPGEAIPGSYWGESEAGLIGERIYARMDTPVHSVLHEAAHFVCMSAERRMQLDTDAGGDHAEENGVCYLQVVLAGLLRQVGSARMLADMDAWGYTFRLQGASAWFHEDAADARSWLVEHGIIDAAGHPTFACR